MTVTANRLSPVSNPLAGIDPDILPTLAEMAVLRVSARDRSKLANIEETGRRLLGHVRSVAYLDTLPENLLEDTAAAEELRRRHGVITLYRRHASPYAEQPGAIMGYFVPAPPDGGVLFIHDSAADMNVFVPDDALPRVAFAELLVAIYAANPTLATCYFTEWSRWIRDEGPAQRVKTASQLYSVALWNGNRPVDLISTGGSLITEIEGKATSSERKAIRKRTTVGVLNALTEGKKKDRPAWPYAYALLALGYDLARDDRGDFITIADGKTRWRPIELAAASEITAHREMLKLLANGETWTRSGKPLVDAKVRCRGQAHDGLTYDQLTPKQLERAVRSMVNERNLTLWETGWYERDKDVPVPTEGDLDGYEVTPRHGTYGIIDIRSYFGLPEGGFLDAATAAAIRERLAQRGTKDGDQNTDVALLAYLKPYSDTNKDDFTWQRRISATADNYVLRQRDRASCFDRRGHQRGWDQHEGDLVLTVRRNALETDIAAELGAALAAIATQLAPLQLRKRQPTDRRKQVQDALQAQRVERDNLAAAAEAADKLALACQTPGEHFDPAAALRWSATGTANRAAVDAVNETIHRLEDELRLLDADAEHCADIDLSVAATLAGVLLGYAGHPAPIEINQLLRRHGLDTLRLDLDPTNSRRVHWSVTLTFDLVDGTPAELQLNGTLRNFRRDQDSDRTTEELGEALAEDFLRHGHALDRLTTRYGITRPYAVDLLRSWLTRHGVVKRGLRGAIVDLPSDMTETRAALWSALSGDLLAGQQLQPLRRKLGATYLSDRLHHPNAYVRTDCTLARRALNAMVDALPASGTDGVDVAALARAIGVTQTEINQLCGDTANTGRTDGRYAGILVRDKLNPRIVRMRPCPHSDCDAASGYRWLSYYLPVPETADYNGLICPSCERLPDLKYKDLRLPASYFDTPWDGPAAAGNFPLGDGPATIPGDPARYRPGSRLPRSGRIYSLTEAATELGITNYALRSWAQADTDPILSTRIQGARGGKFMFSRETLDAAAASDRLRHLQTTAPRIKDQPIEGLLTLKQITAATGVAEHFLRNRIDSGLLQPTLRQLIGGGGIASMLFSPDVLEPHERPDGTPAPLPRAWIERHQAHLLTAAKAAHQVGRTVKEVNSAMRDGALAFHLTDRGTRMIDPTALAGWDRALTENGPMLTPQAAADHVGIGYERLRTAARTGALPSTQTSGGHRRFTLAALDRWKHAGCPTSATPHDTARHGEPA